MKTNRNFLFIVVASLVVPSCTKQEFDKTQESDNVIYDSFVLEDVATKTVLGEDGVSVSWTVNEDKISYIGGKDSEDPHSGNKKTAVIGTGNIIKLERFLEDDNYYILYHTPGHVDNLGNMNNYSLSECRFYAISPDHGDGSFDNAFVCGAKTDVNASSITMKPLNALMEFKSLPRQDIKKVTLKGNNSEYVNGRIQVDFSQGTYPSKFGNTYSSTDSKTSYISIDDSNRGGLLYFGVMPQTMSNGYTLTFYGITGEGESASDYVVATVKNSNESSFAQGSIKPLLQSSISAEYPIYGIAKGNDKNGGDFCQSLNVDGNVTLAAPTKSGSTSQQGMLLNDLSSWRLYYARGTEFTITSTKANTKVKIIYSYDSSKGEGAFFDGDTQIISGDTIDLGDSLSKTLALRRINSSEKNFQLNITSVKVSYPL